MAAAATATPPATPAKLTKSQLLSILGRNQGPENFFQQPFTALTSPQIPKNLNLNRPCERLHVIWTGRVNVTGANYTNVNAEAPQNIIQSFRLTGTHAKYGSLTPFNITGATAFAWARLFRTRGSSLYINGTRQPELNVPLSQNPVTFGNIGSYDLEIHYNLPFVPLMPVSSKLSTIPYLLMSGDWGDTLQLQLFFGDATSFGTPGGATVTFTAFGSNAGNPVVNILQNFEILGPVANQLNTAVVIRSEQTITQGLSANANAVRLALLQKQKTTNIVFKTGLLASGSSAGVSVFASMSDTILDFTQPVVDNKPIRNNQFNKAAKEYAGFAFDTVMPGGYNNFTFVDSSNPATAYRGDLIAGGSTFELDSNVINSNALAAVGITQEQIIGNPGAAS